MIASLKQKQILAFTISLVTLTSVLSACKSQSRTEQKIQQDTSSTEIEGSLVFNNVDLEQADEKGNPLWKVKAKQVTYSQDKQIARIANPTGDLYQDGKIVLKVSAKSGEIEKNGQIVFLKEEITATDTRNGMVFRGDELEWHPKEDLLVIRRNLKGNHPQLQATATEGRYFSRKQQVELMGKVDAISKDPNLQMKTEHLVWQIPQQLVNGITRTRIERYQNKTVTDRVEADQSEVNLKTKIAILKQNIQLTSIEPPLLMSTNSAVWNLNAETVLSDQPIRIVHQKENVIITANQGQIDLQRKVANLTGGVQGVGSQNQAKLYSNQLRWDIPTQNMQASGNVMYQQVNPPFNTQGEKAVGKLQNKSVVVSSGTSGRVVTRIIP